MIIKCPKCDSAYEYDDVFDLDEPVTAETSANWTCDKCHTQYVIKLDFVSSTQLISSVVVPLFECHWTEFAVAVSTLRDQDPDFLDCELDKTEGKAVLFAMGELHLEILIARLRSAIDFEIVVDEPRIRYHGVTLEPIMTVEVIACDIYVGLIRDEISNRDGRIQSVNSSRPKRGRVYYSTIQFYVPLVNMFGWITKLRSISEDATSCMKFLRYASSINDVK